MTRFESSEDGIKSTTSKIADVEGVLIEEVLSEPEQERGKPLGDVTIEEVREEGENFSSIIIFQYKFKKKSRALILSRNLYKNSKSVQSVYEQQRYDLILCFDFLKFQWK